MENMNLVIAKNISEYRKNAKLTQSELATKLNFTDKSVSKWERGESIPDINVLIAMCELFGITLNDLCYKTEKLATPTKSVSGRNHLIISLLSSLLPWLIATISFVLCLIFAPNIERSWLIFIYAIPVMFIILIVFSAIWGTKLMTFLSVSTLIWTLILPICLTFVGENMWYLLLIAVPLQIATCLWFMIKPRPRKKNN